MKKKLMFATNLLPYPPDNGASLKAYHTLQHLAKDYSITLISFIRGKEELTYRKHLHDFCQNIVCIRIRRSLLRNLFFGIKSLVSHKPFFIIRDHSSKMRAAIEKITKKEQFDLIYVDHLQMAQYFYNGGIPRVLDQHNIESALVRRYLPTVKNPIKRSLLQLEYNKLKAYETATCRSFDLVLTVSENDKTRLENLGIEQVKCIPIGLDTKQYKLLQTCREAQNIIFLGTMYWPPNVDAVRWFHQNIWPQILKTIPGATFTVIGKRPPRSIRRLASKPGVTILGYLPDPIPRLKDGAVFIVPLRIAGGMRVKILTAMAWGLPVVSTSIGAEGITCSTNKNILLADDPETFSQAVIHLLQNHELRKNLLTEARKLIETTYDWKIILAKLDCALKEITRS